MSTRSCRPKEQTTLDAAFGGFVAGLGQAVEQLHNGHSLNGEVEQLRSLLETLPLSTEEFGLASNRLHNARLYLEREERGYARWELNNLLQQLRRRVEAEPVDPRRRSQR